MSIVYSSSGSEKMVLGQPTLDRTEGWETKAMRRLFRFKKNMERASCWVLSKNGKGGRNDVDEDEALLLF